LKHETQITLIGLHEIIQEGRKPFGLDVEIARRPDELGESLVIQLMEPLRGQEMGLFEIGNGLFDIGPVGILGQDGPDTDLKRGLPRPPVLGTHRFIEMMINLLKGGWHNA